MKHLLRDFRQDKHSDYYWKVFFPFIRTLNLERATRNLSPILVTGIDGYPTVDFPEEAERIYGSLHCDLLWNRENGTSQNFQKLASPILNQFQGKMIVYYHFLHLATFPTENIQRVLSDSDGSGWKLEILRNTPKNWLSMVFQAHPDWRSQTSIILFDEIYRLGNSEWQRKKLNRLIVSDPRS